jgi:hypothetical protein
MGSGEVEATPWRDVPNDKEAQWRGLFDVSMEGVDLSSACPVCGGRALHRWFNLHRSRPTVEFGRKWVGPGSQWQWCSNCRSYEHTRALVPDWWKSDLVVPEAELHHDPGPIESARLKL